jgi:hypothetical protein
VIATLVDKEIVQVQRTSQDGVRVSAGASSFRREQRLQELLAKAKEHVAELRRQVDSPAYAVRNARQNKTRQRAARERQQRLEQAIAQVPELQERQRQAEGNAPPPVKPLTPICAAIVN